MKRTNVNNKVIFVIMNAMLAFAAIMSACGLCTASENSGRWLTAVLLLGLTGSAGIKLTEKQQRLCIAATIAGTLITAAILIISVGSYILNIRYFAIVIMAATALLSISQMICCIAGTKDKEIA